jgi:hypothetical protein
VTSEQIASYSVFPLFGKQARDLAIKYRIVHQHQQAHDGQIVPKGLTLPIDLRELPSTIINRSVPQTKQASNAMCSRL